MACDQLPALLAPPMCPAEAHGAGLHCAPAPLDAPPDEAVEGCLFAHTLRTTRGPGFGFGGPSDILLADHTQREQSVGSGRSLAALFFKNKGFADGPSSSDVGDGPTTKGLLLEKQGLLLEGQTLFLKGKPASVQQAAGWTYSRCSEDEGPSASLRRDRSWPPALRLPILGNPNEQPPGKEVSLPELLLGARTLARVWLAPAIAAFRAPNQHLFIEWCATRFGFGPGQPFHEAADSLQRPQ